MYMSFSTIPYLELQTNHEFVRNDLSAPAIFLQVWAGAVGAPFCCEDILSNGVKVERRGILLIAG